MVFALGEKVLLIACVRNDVQILIDAKSNNIYSVMHILTIYMRHKRNRETVHSYLMAVGGEGCVDQSKLVTGERRSVSRQVYCPFSQAGQAQVSQVNR